MPASHSDLPEGSSRERPPGAASMIYRLSAVMLAALALLVLLAVTIQDTASDSTTLPALNPLDLPPSTETSPEGAWPRLSTTTLRDLSSHPSTALAPYMNPSATAERTGDTPVLRQFHILLDQYVQRQRQDDNFTVRAIDRRTHDPLEVVELAELRADYRRGADIDWREVDRRRREITERLVDKYEARGVPVEDIAVRWGRAQQVEKAHERDRPYRAYEIRLAEYLGLSLLAVEIGTVETFNQDHLVSAADARSRYQMLPWILRRSGVNEYRLPVDEGSSLQVRESLHPLLVLEPAFLLLRGYVNTVGHEIPGLSAYHTGPGNIFKLFRKYYTSEHFSSSSTVADAYAWAVTEGFETVTDGTTFGGHSRGYVPSAYGALVAHDEVAVDPTETIRAVRVQLRPDTSTTLRGLLTALDASGTSFDWGPAADRASTYERFRAFNPHFDLPASPDGTIPPAANARLVPSTDGKAVRFFLPLEAPTALRAAGVDVLDPAAAFRYDGSTYRPPDSSEITFWDRRYAALVEDIEHFGFTRQNWNQLMALHEKFERLAEQRPSRFRRIQLAIIRTHRRIWRSNPWEELADATRLATGRMQFDPAPPDSVSPERLIPDSIRALQFDP